MKNARRSAVVGGNRFLALACGGVLCGLGACSSGGGGSGSGGAQGSGGVSGGSGGTSGTGGVSGGSGGASGTGGASVSGGASGSGGVQGTGGGTAGAGSGTGGAAGGTTGGGGAIGGGGTTAVGGSTGLGATLGTATRPQLTATQAADYTILKYLAQPFPATVADNWGATAIAGVGDVATFTPMFTVAATGGTHTTVQAAITAAVAVAGTARIYIRVMPGTYRELVCVLGTAPPITLYSTSADATQTVIVFNNLAGTAPGGPMNPCITPAAGAITIGTDGSATFAAYGANFQAKNLTISNDAVQTTVTNGGTQGVALHSRGDRAIYENVRFLGHQDTILVKTGNVAAGTRSYFKSSYIEGDVDFICGRATAVFDGSTIHFLTRANGGQFVAPSTPAANTYGFLIIGSMLTADAGATGLRLGRAWDEGVATGAYVAGTSPNGQTVIRDSMLSAGVPTNMAATWNASTSTRAYSVTGNRLYEFNNTGPGAAVP